MRKILFKRSVGSAAPAASYLHARFALFGICLAVTSWSTTATAQTPSTIAPTVTSLGNMPTTGLLDSMDGVPTVDASYSVLKDSTSIAPAAYGQPVREPRGFERWAKTNPCDAGCDVSFYLAYDALFLRRENDERFSLSLNSFMPDFEYEFGGRYTIGQLLDCVNGWEVSYVGPFEWERQATVTGAGNLQSRFALNGLVPGVIDSFNNADFHSQSWRSELQTIEFNRRWWSWDVLSTMIGIRYVDYEENYSFASTHATNGNGLYAESVDNQMIGAQIGGDIIYPVGLRTSVAFRGKAGVYANFSERATVLTNGGTLILNAGDTNTDIAGLIEMGVRGNYQLVPSVRLNAGYEFWYLPQIATVPEQVPFNLTPASGSNVFAEDDLLFHGGSFGVEVLF